MGVVQAYNEEGLVGQVIYTMLAFVDKIVIVDDWSKGYTPLVLQRRVDEQA